MKWVMENPATGCMRVQPFMNPMKKYLNVIDYCSYKMFANGEWQPYKFRKPTALWTNCDGWEVRRCTCPGQRHASSLIGDRARGKRYDFGQGRTPPLAYKHAVPHEVQLMLLRRAKRAAPHTTWCLDLFSGGQSLKVACELEGLRYVGVDILPKAKAADGTMMHTDIVEDLSRADLADLVRRGAKIAGTTPEELCLCWISPPCTTYSQAQTLCPVSSGRRHRDYSHPLRPPISEAAHHDDAMVSHIVKQLVALEQRTPHFDGWCVTVPQPLASNAVTGAARGLPLRFTLPEPQWVAVHAACRPRVKGVPCGAVVGYVHVKATGGGRWRLNGCHALDTPVKATGGGAPRLFRCEVPLPLPPDQ